MSSGFPEIKSFTVSNACRPEESCEHATSLTLVDGRVFKKRLSAEDIDLLITSLPREQVFFAGGWGGVDARRHFHVYEGRSTSKLSDLFKKIISGVKEV